MSTEQKLWLSKLKHQEHNWQSHRQTRKQHGTRVRRGYDALEQSRENLEATREILSSNSIEFVKLPQVSSYQPILVVSERDVEAVLESLEDLPEEQGWELKINGRSSQTLSKRKAKARPQEVRRIYIQRRIYGPGGVTVSTPRERIVIEPWEVLPAGSERVDGETHVSGTLHRKILKRGTAIEYLTPANWRRAVDENNSEISWAHPHIFEVTGPIDMVYTWVDGSDPDWRKRKSLEEGILLKDDFNDTAASFSRYASRDELRYSLRSVEYYASWINHIYIVTDRQVPSWLNIEHPKISVIDHREIFSDPSVLPVFNSHAIESQLHHIDGLSEKYIYMNDDFFLMRPVEPRLFYTGNGLSRFFASTAPLDIDSPSARDLPVLSAAKRNRQYIANEHGRTVTNKFKHTPQPQLKSVLEAMERNHPELFAQVSASKFRHPDDYSIPSALYHFEAYARGKAINSRIRYAYMDIARPDVELYLQRLARRRNLDVLCLNDTNTNEETAERLDRLLRSFLEARFPVQSTFEI